MPNSITNKLPVPEQQYPDWSRFVAGVWNHGRSVKHMSPELAGNAVDRASESIKSSVCERNEARSLRPSAFLSCARQSYFFLKGEDSGNMPDEIGSTFAVGHLLHELSYAAVLSALPQGFKAESEIEVELPDWWP